MLPRRLFLILPFLLLGGCQPKAPITPQSPVNSAVFVKDDLGREIALKGVAKRVIVIGDGAMEMVFALGAEKSVVGGDETVNFPDKAKNIAVAGDYQGPSVEKSVSLRPDLVIVQGETYDKSRADDWQNKIGAPVAILSAHNLEGVKKDFLLLGNWLGCEVSAKKLAAGFKTKSPTPRFSAFIQIQNSPLWTAGEGTLVDDIVFHGGFASIAASHGSNSKTAVHGYQAFAVESLLAAQPSVYIVPSKDSREKVLGQLRASPVLSKLKCIQLGRVIVVDDDWLLRPGPRVMLGIAALKRAAADMSTA